MSDFRTMDEDMSPSEADPGGVVVITQLNPQPNPLEPSNMGQVSTTPKSNPLQRFFQGEPVALGVTLILCGVIQISFGIIDDVGYRLHSYWTLPLGFTGTPYWSGILALISGSVSAAAANKPKIGLVRGSLIMNIISAIFSGIAMIVYTLFIGTKVHFYSFITSGCGLLKEPEMCERSDEARNLSLGILFILLIFNLLQICVCISISAFGCKTLCRTTYNEVSVVVYQATVPGASQPDVSAVLLSYEEMVKS